MDKSLKCRLLAAMRQTPCDYFSKLNIISHFDMEVQSKKMFHMDILDLIRKITFALNAQISQANCHG